MNNQKLILLAILFTWNLSGSLFSQEVFLENWSLEKNAGRQPLSTLVPWQTLEKASFKKTPLILIHGTISEFKKFFNWAFLLEEFQKEENQELLEKYEIFTFRYPSNTQEPERLTLELTQGLKELEAFYQKNSTKKPKSKFIVSSLGGNILCDLLAKEPSQSEQISQVISLGTPFWGIPLLNRELIKQGGLSKEEKIANLFLFEGAYLLYPALENFLQWKLLFAKNNSQELAKENTKIYQKHGCFLIREKIITYGAFLESPYNSLSKNKGEEEWLKENLISFDYKHAWNSLMHYKMSRDLFANNSRQYLINFNDGLVPVYSSLFLDPGALGIFFQKKSIDPLLEKIKAPNYKYKSRLFFNLDHTDLTFEHEEETKIKDIITEEEKKNIAKFILEDLEL